MTHGNNLSPIPFYESLSQQDSHKWWAYGDIYPLIVGKGSLIPFFFNFLNATAMTLERINVFKMCCRAMNQAGDYNYDFNADFRIERDGDADYWVHAFSTKLHISTTNNVTQVYYLGDATDLPFEKGRYYMEFVFSKTTGGTTVRKSIYSDVFTCVDTDELSKFVKITWKCASNIGVGYDIIPYASNFENVLYLDTDICQPIYEFEEEGEQRNGYFFPVKQISYKKFTFKITAPEYLLDVMRLIRMADTVAITDKDGCIFNATLFTIEPTWLEGGHYASAECEYTTDTVVKMIGKSVSVS